ncbi:Holliday junction resolvase RuvX [Pelagibacteraceae bacterium]|jgi:putative Holliday junction resolvase|nr:Holliday junction resolvase RuvX [Pelagibacteraceae bacterium]MDB3872998.1 Holliday junction resolvase RuvX [Pelagibacteraceae bacterium]MDC1148615.1 Holliday junction resolvase RuvX [Pelagibacteraceae bacterium]|tara:strand:- start:412 stop:882 length:471 start_codon:yes stop_codon:yes gene_type:complete
METINLCDNSGFHEKVGTNSRILGIDPGKKNIGISISDPSQKIATPLKTIEMKKFKKFIEQLNRVILDYEVKGIVIGNPVNMDGSLGPRSQSAKDFAQNITKITKIPITLWDERLSSEGAFKLMGDLNINSSKKSEKLDQHAAAFILQGYLDFLNK